MAGKARDGLYQRGEIWWLRCDPVTRRRVSTGCRSKAAARAYRERRELIAANPAHAAAAFATLGEWVGKTIQAKRDEDMAPGTIQEYEIKLGHWRRLFGDDLPLSSIDTALFDSFVATRKREHISDHTIGKELSCMVYLLRLAKRRGVWTGDLGELKPLGFSSNYVPRERWLTRGEVALLRREMRPQHFALVAAIICTSCRRSEVKRLTPDSYDRRAGVVTIRGTKNERASRRVPIVREVFGDLWKAVVPHLPLTWTYPTTIMPRIAARLGIASFTPNDLRRTCATWLVRSGASYEIVAQVMGHTDTVMLRRVYAQMSAEAIGERIRSEVKRHNDVTRTRKAPRKARRNR